MNDDRGPAAVKYFRHLISSFCLFVLAAPVLAQESTDVPAPRRSLLKTTRNNRYNMAMSFDPSESGTLLPLPEIDYDVTMDDGKTLRLGPTLFNEKTFLIALGPLARLNPAVARLDGVDGQETVLLLRWPETFLKAGTLEMISRTGTVMWKQDIRADDIATWKQKLENWRRLLSTRGVSDEQLKTGVFATQFMIDGLKEKGAPFWKRKDVFRFCLTQTEGNGLTKICSARYVVQGTEKNSMLRKIASAVPPRVVVMGESGALKAVVPVPAGRVGQFYADLAGGESYEFQAEPPRLDLMDMSDTSKPGLLRVSGYGVRPLDPHVILNPDRYNRWVVMLGFEPTIGDQRKFWAAGIKEKDPRLFFAGEGGGIFRQRFELNEVPRSAARPHLDSNTTKGTYIDGVVLRGRKLPDSTVSSEEYSAEADRRDPSLFEWTFRATEPGQLNKSYLSVTYEGKTYKSFFEVHRAYANELSGRLSGILSSGGMIIVGEVSYNHWFENWLGWDNYWLATQRWGMSARYFKSVNQLDVGSGSKASLDVMTADLKYRLTPGLWTRDETLGAILAYQNVSLGDLKAPMNGVGAFWARSMPRVFNDFFNYFPLMDYPKWVDVEFIYFVNSMKADVKLKSTMALNFHGQVLWKKNLFGEAGFGFKRYGFEDVSLAKEAKLNTFYGTLGLGIKF